MLYFWHKQQIFFSKHYLLLQFIWTYSCHFVSCFIFMVLSFFLLIFNISVFYWPDYIFFVPFTSLYVLQSISTIVVCFKMLIHAGSEFLIHQGLIFFQSPSYKLVCHLEARCLSQICEVILCWNFGGRYILFTCQ